MRVHIYLPLQNFEWITINCKFHKAILLAGKVIIQISNRIDLVIQVFQTQNQYIFERETTGIGADI